MLAKKLVAYGVKLAHQNNMTTPIKISVGLSAYNESANIARVLREVLSQKQSDWELAEVLIYNDGSTDTTLEQISTVTDSKIRVIDDIQRRGKTHRLTQMFREFKGDILVMFDGDIKLKGYSVITDLVKPFTNARVMLVGGNSMPYPPKTFFERCVYSTFEVFYRSRKYLKNGHNIFGCTGSILAIKKELTKGISLPNIINEDAYLYFKCIEKGHLFAYQDKAIVYYKLPNHLNDYLRQAFRSHPEAVDIELSTYFGSRVAKEFARPLSFYVLAVLLTFLRTPIEVITIGAIHLFLKPFYKQITPRYKLSWFTASSTH